MEQLLFIQMNQTSFVFQVSNVLNTEEAAVLTKEKNPLDVANSHVELGRAIMRQVRARLGNYGYKFDEGEAY